MAGGLPAGERADFALHRVRLLVARARVGLWILATFVLLFTGVDWVFNPGNFSPSQLTQITALRAGQLLCIAMAFPALARQQSRRGVVTLCVLFVTVFNAAIVMAGIVTRDVALAPTVLMGTNMFSAAFMPWGPWAQALVAATSTIGVVLNAVALGNSFATVISYNALEAFAVLAASVWVASSLERQRRAVYAAEQARAVAVDAQLREAQVADALARVGREMIEAAGAPQLVDRLCAVTASVLGCDVVHAYLREADGEALTPVAACGERPDLWEILRLVHFTPDRVADLMRRFDEDGLVESPSTGAHDALGEPVATMLKRGGVTRSLFMELRHGDALLGVLHAGNRSAEEPFTDEQRRIARGIAHLAAMTIEHARVRAELERANQVKAHFVATLSHELRNPITAIQGYHQLLLVDSAPLSADQEHIILRADKCARELNELITATLDLSRFATKRVPVDVQAIRLRDLIDELRREIPPSADPMVRLTWHAADDEHVLRTDPLKVKMILRNLVTNALKFTERGSVTTTATPRGGGVELLVEDTGIGIAADKIATIFEPFTQAHGLQSRRKGGAGLGLHLVRRLVDILAGTIEVQSEVGRGSTFRVWLPDASDARVGDGGRQPEAVATARAPSVPAALP